MAVASRPGVEHGLVSGQAGLHAVVGGDGGAGADRRGGPEGDRRALPAPQAQVGELLVQDDEVVDLQVDSHLVGEHAQDLAVGAGA